MLVQLPEGGKYLERVPGGDMEKTLPSVAAFHQQLLEKIAALPGIESSGIISDLPMRGAMMFSFSYWDIRRRHRTIDRERVLTT